MPSTDSTADLKSEIEDLQYEVADLKQQINSLEVKRGAVEYLERQVNRLKEDLTDAETEIDSLKKELAEGSTADLVALAEHKALHLGGDITPEILDIIKNLVAELRGD